HEAVAAHGRLGERRAEALAAPSHGRHVSAEVIRAGVAPVGVGERRVPRVGVQEEGAAVAQRERPQVDPREKRAFVAREGGADPRHDVEVEDEGEGGGDDPVEERGHARALRKISASRGTTAPAEYSSRTRARAAAPIRRRISVSFSRRSRASTHSSSFVAWNPVRPCSTMSRLTPTGLTTGGMPSAMYWRALSPHFPRSHSASGR